MTLPAFLLRRLLFSVPLLVGVLFFTFALVRIGGQDPVALLAGPTATVQEIELVRRDYFLNVQGGRASTAVIDEAALPAKADAVRGIAWLPRLLPKARAKLRGELPASLMYCCGGDRRFFREHNILPAEFLALTWRHGNDPDAVIDWVVRRRAAAG